MDSKVLKRPHTPPKNENISSLISAIVIPKEITTADIHQKIEEYQLALRYSSSPSITKPGAAYELIKLGLKSLGMIS